MEPEDAPAEGGSFELLAAVEAVTELEESHIVPCDRINQVPRGPKLTKSKFVVIFIVQDIEEG